MFTREGDIQLFINTFEHICGITYKRAENNSDAILSEMSISKFHNYCDLRFNLNTTSKIATKHLIQVMHTIGFRFSTDEFRDDFEQCKFDTNSKPVIRNFIRALAIADPAYSQIEAEICQAVGVDFSHIPPMPLWRRADDFRFRLADRVVRRVTYKRNCVDSHTDAVSELELVGTRDRDFILDVSSPSILAARTFLEAILRAGLQNDCERLWDKKFRFRFNQSTRDKFEQLIAVISSLCDISSIIAEIREKLDEAQQYVHPLDRIFGRFALLGAPPLSPDRTDEYVDDNLHVHSVRAV